MASKKWLFLDIDGVLNSYQSVDVYRHLLKRNENDFKEKKQTYKEFMAEEFCLNALANLQRIVEQTKCKIIISSTWRNNQSLEQMKGWFKGMPIIQNAIIDKTPNICLRYEGKILDSPRGLEIQAWLRHNDVQYYNTNDVAILDDDNDMWSVSEFFFQVDSKVGLDIYTADKVIEFLNGKPADQKCILI